MKGARYEPRIQIEPAQSAGAGSRCGGAGRNRPGATVRRELRAEDSGELRLRMEVLQGRRGGRAGAGFLRGGWWSLDLPHDWSIEGPFGEKEPAAGRRVSCPPASAGTASVSRCPTRSADKMVTVEFDGVYQNSEVWINGQYLGKRPYGYIPFAYDITPHLDFGGDNVMAVRVDNSHQTNCRWYSGSGIYRHTWLLATNKVHIAHWGTFVTTPRVSEGRGHGAGGDPRPQRGQERRPHARWRPAFSTGTGKRCRPRRRRRRSRPAAITSSCSR